MGNLDKTKVAASGSSIETKSNAAASRKHVDDAKRQAEDWGLDISKRCVESTVALLLVPEREDAAWEPVENLGPKTRIENGYHGGLFRVGEYPQFTALKQFKKRDRTEPERLEFHEIRELALHDGLSGEHRIVEALGIYEGDDSLYMSMEYYPVSLGIMINACEDAGRYLTMGEIKFLFKQVLDGLSWIHSRSVVHRDLNPSNIMLNFEGRARITDFGDARKYAPGQHVTPGVGTMWYRAPELCLGAEVYGYQVDIWSAGCVLAELLVLEPILQGDTDIQMVELIGRLLGKPREFDIEFLETFTPDAVKWQVMDEYQGLRETGTLEMKFGRYGKETMAMLQGFLAWDSRARWSADEARGTPFVQLGRNDAVRAADAWWNDGDGEIKREVFKNTELLCTLKAYWDESMSKEEFSRRQQKMAIGAAAETEIRKI